ncbi:hypothetical protein KC347_g85 [Hortaea werneckii]|nr:hypothetical protein KC347_g85 [Hortaea werneckii]
MADIQERRLLNLIFEAGEGSFRIRTRCWGSFFQWQLLDETDVYIPWCIVEYRNQSRAFWPRPCRRGMRHGAFASVSNNTQLCGSALSRRACSAVCRLRFSRSQRALKSPPCSCSAAAIRVGRRSSVSALRSGPAALREEVVTLE